MPPPRRSTRSSGAVAEPSPPKITPETPKKHAESPKKVTESPKKTPESPRKGDESPKKISDSTSANTKNPSKESPKKAETEKGLEQRKALLADEIPKPLPGMKPSTKKPQILSAASAKSQPSKDGGENSPLEKASSVDAAGKVKAPAVAAASGGGAVPVGSMRKVVIFKKGDQFFRRKVDPDHDAVEEIRKQRSLSKVPADLWSPVGDGEEEEGAKVTDADGAPLPKLPLPPGLQKVSMKKDEELTENNCGRCVNCCRRPCQECSHCKRSDYENCIDKYCMNQREGQQQRMAMREMYMKHLQKQHTSSGDVTTSSAKDQQMTSRPRKQVLEQRKALADENPKPLPGIKPSVKKPQVLSAAEQNAASKTSPSPNKTTGGRPLGATVKLCDSATDSESGIRTQMMKNHVSENVVFLIEDGTEDEDEYDEVDNEGGILVDKGDADLVDEVENDEELTGAQKAEKIVSLMQGNRAPRDQGPRTPRASGGDLTSPPQDKRIIKRKAEQVGHFMAPRQTGYVYGASASSKKLRRCGECEGCMREDCGNCDICKDKPRFGGEGKLKKACVHRKCSVVQPKKRARYVPVKERGGSEEEEIVIKTESFI